MVEEPHLQRTCFSAHSCVMIEICCVHCGYIYFSFFLAEFTLCPHHITVYITLKSIFITCLSVQWCRQMEHLQILQCGNLYGCQFSLNKPEGFPPGPPRVTHSSNSSTSTPRNASPLLFSPLLFAGEPNYKSHTRA